MPTHGITNSASGTIWSLNTVQSGSTLYGKLGTFAAGGTVSRISVFLRYGDTSSQEFYVLLYDDATGNLLHSSAKQIVTNSDDPNGSWHHVEIPDTVLGTNSEPAVAILTEATTTQVRGVGSSVGYNIYESNTSVWNDAGSPTIDDPFTSTTANRADTQIVAYITYDAFTITDVNTDETTSQYQVINATVTNAAGNVVSATLNGIALTIIDATAPSIQLRAPGNLDTGTYDLVLNDGAEDATISVSHTQTHAIVAPSPGTSAHENSVYYNQGSEAGDYVDPPTIPANNGTYDLLFKTGVSAFTTANLVEDLRDVLQAETGTPDGQQWTLSFSKIHSDGTTDTWDITITSDDGVLVPSITSVGGDDVVEQDETNIPVVLVDVESIQAVRIGGTSITLSEADPSDNQVAFTCPDTVSGSVSFEMDVNNTETISKTITVNIPVPSIGTVGGDDSVALAETITAAVVNVDSVTEASLGGISLTLIDSDPTDNSVSFAVPLTVGTGTKELRFVVNGGTAITKNITVTTLTSWIDIEDNDNFDEIRAKLNILGKAVLP